MLNNVYYSLKFTLLLVFLSRGFGVNSCVSHWLITFAHNKLLNVSAVLHSHKLMICFQMCIEVPCFTSERPEVLWPKTA